MESLDPNSPPEPLPLSLDASQTTPICREDAGLGLLDAAIVVVFAAASLIFSGTITAAIFSAAHRTQHLSPDDVVNAFSHSALAQVSVEFAAYVLLLIFMTALVWKRHQTGLLKGVGWNPPGKKYLVNALILGVGLAMIVDIGEFALGRWIPNTLPISELFKDRASALLLGGFAILVAPLMEELVFRGFIYPALARWTGAGASVLITAFLFTLLHGAQLGYYWAPLLLIFIVGVTLTVTRAVTNSVATCVVVHMTYNFALLLPSFILTHGFRQM